MKAIILSAFNSSTPPNNTPLFSFSLYHTLLLAFTWLIYFVHFPPFCLLVSVFCSCCRFYMNNIMTATAQISRACPFLSFVFPWRLGVNTESCRRVLLEKHILVFLHAAVQHEINGDPVSVFVYVSWRSHKQQSQHIQEKLPSKI